MKAAPIWNLQFHRTIHGNSGTNSQDIYTLRTEDLKAPYYTVAVPNHNKEMIYALAEALNHRVVYEKPAELPEVEAIFHGPWHKNGNIGERHLVVTEKEVKILTNTYHALSARLITIEHELETLKKAYTNLDRLFNLQSKVVMRLRHSNQPFEDEVSRPNVPDLFKLGDEFDRSVPQFDYGNPMEKDLARSVK